MGKPALHVPPPGTVGPEGYIHIPIRIADYLASPSYKPTTIQKLRNKVAKTEDQKPRWISMSQDDYLAFWAKDDEGNFLGCVNEPAQGQVEWLRHQVRLNDLWRESGQMRTLAGANGAAIYLNW